MRLYGILISEPAAEGEEPSALAEITQLGRNPFDALELALREFNALENIQTEWDRLILDITKLRQIGGDDQ